MVVFVWWCLRGGDFVVVFLWWCLRGGVCVVVFVWCFYCGGVFVVVFESSQQHCLSHQNKGSINQGCHKPFYRHMFC